MSDATPAVPRTRGVIGLIAAIAGAALMAWSFVTGISAALDGSGSGAFAYEVLFIAGGVLVVGALVLAIVHLVRGQSRLLAVLTIVASVLPLVAVIIVATVSNASV